MTRQHAPCNGFGAGLTVATVLLLVAGCGGCSVWATDDGGAGHDGGGEVGECQAPGDCVVAWRVNECCSCYEPVSAAELAADPCLIPPEQSFVPEECWVDCFFYGDCAVCPTHEWTPTCEDGVCIWLESYCTAPEDCLVGIWVNDCCTQAMPVRRATLLSEPCLVSWPIFEIPQQCRDQWAEECMFIAGSSPGGGSPPDSQGRLPADLVVRGGTVLAGPTGDRENPLGLVERGAVACWGSRVVAVGTEVEVLASIHAAPQGREVDAQGGLVTLGLVDPHTHLVFGGDRSGEFGSFPPRRGGHRSDPHRV